jgi:hypothetical protein
LQGYQSPAIVSVLELGDDIVRCLQTIGEVKHLSRDTGSQGDVHHLDELLDGHP